MNSHAVYTESSTELEKRSTSSEKTKKSNFQSDIGISRSAKIKQSFVMLRIAQNRSKMDNKSPIQIFNIQSSRL